MLKDLKRILIGVGLVIGIIFFLFIVNQFILFFELVKNIHPYLAIFLTSITVIALVYVIWKTASIWLMAPKAPLLPADPSQEEYEEYLIETKRILKLNTKLKDIDFDSEEYTNEELVTMAFDKLDELSFPLIKENANTIFLSTAISQNGSLDSILVLTSMIRMVWQLAKVYQTRPSLKSISKLYLQVAGVIFMARSLEDSDIIEQQIEPLIATILGESLASAIPGMVPIANLIVSSIMEGSLNAFLALRVGIVAQSYLGMEVPQSKGFIRKTSSLHSLTYMRDIIKDNSRLVVSTIVNSVKKAGSNTAKRWFRKKDIVEE